MGIPRNVVRFEALLLASLLVDTLSAAFDPTTFGEPGETDRAGFIIFAFLFLCTIMLLIWLAAQHAQNWARWSLTLLVGMSALAYLAGLDEKGFSFGSLIDTLSLGCSVAGVYYAFTDDAKDWFRQGRPV